MANTEKSLKIGIEVDAAAGISEQERYNAKLKEMAKLTEEVTAAEKSANEEAARTIRLNEAKAEAATRAAAATAEAKAADEEIAKTVKTVGAEDVKAALASSEATGKSFASKKQLKDMVKQLGHEFPLLGQVGRLALNPIAFASTAIISAFVIWRTRVEELKSAYASFQLPNLSPPDPARINASAKAWSDYLTVLKTIKQEANSIETVTNRTLANIKTVASQLKALQEAKEKGPTGAIPKAAALEHEAARQEFETRKKEAAAIRARGLARQAAGINENVASPEDDAANLEQLKKNADVAREAMEKSRKVRGTAVDAAGGDRMAYLKLWPTLVWRKEHGFDRPTPQRIIEQEDENIKAQQAIIDAYNNRLKQGPDRDARRQSRADNFSGAAADKKTADNIDSEANKDWFNANVNYGIALRAAGMPVVHTPTGVGGTVSDAAAAELLRLEALNKNLMDHLERLFTTWQQQIDAANNRAAASPASKTAGAMN